MDPEACCRELIACLAAGDTGQAALFAAQLSEWMAVGGFPPRERLIAEMLEALSQYLYRTTRGAPTGE